MEKFKTLPMLMQIMLVAMVMGVVAAGILTLCGIELGSPWSGLMFIIAMVGAYFIVSNNK